MPNYSSEKIAAAARFLGKKVQEINQILGVGEEFAFQIIAQATEIGQVWDIYKEAYPDSPVRILAAQKWDAMALEEAKKATTREQILEAWDHAREGSEAESLLMNNFVEVCSTTEELKEAFDYPLSGVSERRAVEKLLKLL